MGKLKGRAWTDGIHPCVELCLCNDLGCGVINGVIYRDDEEGVSKALICLSEWILGVVGNREWAEIEGCGGREVVFMDYLDDFSRVVPGMVQ